MDKCYLYHICNPDDKGNLDRGYIGISTNPERRINKRHLQGKGNPIVFNALKKYGTLEITLISEGSVEDMLEMEKWLRPEDGIGWNIVAGGGMPPSPKGRSWSEEQTAKFKESAPRGKEHIAWTGYWVVDGIKYLTRKEVALAYGIHPATVSQRIKSKHFPNWKKDGYNG